MSKGLKAFAAAAMLGTVLFGCSSNADSTVKSDETVVEDKTESVVSDVKTDVSEGETDAKDAISEGETDVKDAANDVKDEASDVISDVENND